MKLGPLCVVRHVNAAARMPSPVEGYPDIGDFLWDRYSLARLAVPGLRPGPLWEVGAKIGGGPRVRPTLEHVRPCAGPFFRAVLVGARAARATGLRGRVARQWAVTFGLAAVGALKIKRRAPQKDETA